MGGVTKPTAWALVALLAAASVAEAQMPGAPGGGAAGARTGARRGRDEPGSSALRRGRARPARSGPSVRDRARHGRYGRPIRVAARRRRDRAAALADWAGRPDAL